MALSNKQKAAAELIVTNPELTLAEVADQLKVSEVTLWRWRNKEEFKEYEHELCVARFKELEKLAVQKLKENVIKNNQRAIEYVLDFTGYKAGESVNIKSDRITVTIDED